MPMEDTYGIQSRIGSIIVVERWYCCRGSPVFSDRNIQSGKNGVLVSQNTDFISIIQNREGNGSYFYQGNLVKFEKQLHKSGEKYLNTTENWRKYYIGTIVAPIRAANDILFYRTENEDYCIWGFLCVDSLSKSAFPKNKEKDYTHIVKSYASILFNVLSSVC